MESTRYEGAAAGLGLEDRKLLRTEACRLLLACHEQRIIANIARKICPLSDVNDVVAEATGMIAEYLSNKSRTINYHDFINNPNFRYTLYRRAVVDFKRQESRERIINHHTGEDQRLVNIVDIPKEEHANVGDFRNFEDAFDYSSLARVLEQIKNPKDRKRIEQIIDAALDNQSMASVAKIWDTSQSNVHRWYHDFIIRFANKTGLILPPTPKRLADFAGSGKKEEERKRRIIDNIYRMYNSRLNELRRITNRNEKQQLLFGAISYKLGILQHEDLEKYGFRITKRRPDIDRQINKVLLDNGLFPYRRTEFTDSSE